MADLWKHTHYVSVYYAGTAYNYLHALDIIHSVGVQEAFVALVLYHFSTQFALYLDLPNLTHMQTHTHTRDYSHQMICDDNIIYVIICTPELPRSDSELHDDMTYASVSNRASTGLKFPFIE